MICGSSGGPTRIRRRRSCTTGPIRCSADRVATFRLHWRACPKTSRGWAITTRRSTTVCCVPTTTRRSRADTRKETVMASLFDALVLSPYKDGVTWWLDQEIIYPSTYLQVKVPSGFETDFASVPWLFTNFLPRWGDCD